MTLIMERRYSLVEEDLSWYKSYSNNNGVLISRISSSHALSQIEPHSEQKKNKSAFSSRKKISHQKPIIDEENINYNHSFTPNQKVVTPISSHPKRSFTDNEIPEFLSIPLHHEDFSIADSNNDAFSFIGRTSNSKRRKTHSPVSCDHYISLRRKTKNNLISRTQLEENDPNNLLSDNMPLDLYMPTLSF